MSENRWTLTSPDLHHASTDFTVTANDFGLSQPGFSVHRRTLHGGLREGVEVVEIDNGHLRLSVLPTRGMSIWKGWLGDTPIGWDSPVRGPIHPQFVPLDEPSGLGFLDGFDEWLVRCGLVSNGASEFDAAGRLKYGLHGRIANLPASRLELEIDVEREEIRLTGTVVEARFLMHHLQLQSTLVTRFGQSGLTVRDQVTNLSAQPGEMQLLYHINFGPPLLDAGARLIAPATKVVPRNAHSAAGREHWDRFAGPQAGYVEEVFFADLAAQGQQTRVLLKSGAGNLGASLGFDRTQLPCFILWKNTAALADGYVAGIEPATNYPNPRSFEKAQGRVVPLAPGASAQFELSIDFLTDTASLERAERDILAMTAGRPAELCPAPQPGWTEVGG